MASVWYPKFKELALGLGCGSGTKPTGTLKAALVDTGTYTYNAAHQYYSSVSGVVGTPVAIGSPTFINGVLDGNDATVTAVTGNTAEAIVIYLDTGTAATSPLIYYHDGRAQFEVAADASSGATSITIEDLPLGVGNGATLTKISGTGPSTITTSATGAAGARTLSVAALASGITAGALYEYAYTGSGLPFTPNSGDCNLVWSASGIAAL